MFDLTHQKSGQDDRDGNDDHAHYHHHHHDDHDQNDDLQYGGDAERNDRDV